MKLNWKSTLRKFKLKEEFWAISATNHVIPTAIRYQNTLIENVKGLKDGADFESIY
jgi:glutamine synthetase